MIEVPPKPSTETPVERQCKQEHKRMVNVLFRDKSILARALGLDPQKLWIRGIECPLDEATGEKADMIFQDKWNAYRGDLTATCFVVELKSDFADHEVLGQLKKAVDIFERIGKSTRHWGRTVGVAIAPKFTDSGLRLLEEGPYYSFRWSEHGSVTLCPAGKVFKQEYVSPDGIIRKARKRTA
jgi:hypothetical protein